LGIDPIRRPPRAGRATVRGRRFQSCPGPGVSNPRSVPGDAGLLCHVPMRATRLASKTRLFLVDDHPVIRRGLQLIISPESNLAVCGEASTVALAYQRILEEKPDLAIIDLSLGDGSGLDLIRRLHEQLPQLRILVLSMHHEPFYAQRALQAGASGYVTKAEGVEHSATPLWLTLRRQASRKPVAEGSQSAVVACALPAHSKGPWGVILVRNYPAPSNRPFLPTRVALRAAIWSRSSWDVSGPRT
jgi:CheY-like chemotaxis protein